LLQKLFDFDNFLNKLEFKHLIMDLVDEWYHAKEYVLDDLNIVREYIENQIKEKIKARDTDMGTFLQKMEARKEIIVGEFDSLRAMRPSKIPTSSEESSTIATKMANFTTSILLFDLDASKMLIEQPVSIPRYQTFLTAWQATRDKMEREMDPIARDIEKWIEHAAASSPEITPSLDGKVSLQRFFSTYVRSAVQDFKGILDEFQVKNERVSEDLAIKNFEEIEKTINFKKSKLLDLVESKAYTIEKYWRQLSQASRDIEFILGISRLKEDWLTTKANIIDKIRAFYHDQMQHVDAEKIRQMLRIINPIPIEALKSKIRSISSTDDVGFIEGILDIVQKHRINAQVQKNALINVQDYLLAGVQGTVVKIKTSVSSRGNTVVLKALIENTSIQDLFDVVVSLKLPSFLIVSVKQGNNSRESITTLESGKNITLEWDIDECKNKVDTIEKKSIQASKISIIVSGKLSSDHDFSKIEDLCFILKA
jgi:hypothetical protein